MGKLPSARDFSSAQVPETFIGDHYWLLHIDTLRTASEDGLYLDKLDVERHRGITVKAQSASMLHIHNTETYLLNLVDTPGHVDFNYEVSRALSACQGALLLVDATRGVQAQTLANFYLAFEANLRIIPVINKVDLGGADVARVVQDFEDLGFHASEIYKVVLLPTTMQNALNILPKISAKTGLGVADLFPAVIQQIPPCV